MNIEEEELELLKLKIFIESFVDANWKYLNLVDGNFMHPLDLGPLLDRPFSLQLLYCHQSLQKI